MRHDRATDEQIAKALASHRPATSRWDAAARRSLMDALPDDAPERRDLRTLVHTNATHRTPTRPHPTEPTTDDD